MKKKVPHKEKRSKKRVIILLSVIVVILGLLLFGAYGYIFFDSLVAGGLSISLEPNQIFKSTTKDKPVDLAFSVDVKNILLCKAACEYSFTDLSENKVLDQGEFTAQGIKELERSYTITPPTKGTGQLAYRFSVSCTNKEAFLCFSDETPKERSAFATVGYELSAQEREFTEQVRNITLSYFAQVLSFEQAVYATQQEYTYYNRSIALPTVSFVPFVSAVLFHTNEVPLLKEAWKEEQFAQVDTKVASLQEELATRQKELVQVQEQLANAREIHTQARSTLHNVSGHLEQMQLDEEYVVVNKSEELLELFFVQQHLVDSVRISNSSSQAELLREVIEQQKGVDAFNESLVKDLKKKYDLFENATASLNITAQGEAMSTQYRNLCNDTQLLKGKGKVHNEYCSFALPINITSFDFSLPPLVPLNSTPLTASFALELYEHKPVCCLFGSCSACCQGPDCLNKKELYPVLLVHGHAFSQSAPVAASFSVFDSLVDGLEQDGYIDVGALRASNTQTKDLLLPLGSFGKPIVAQMTYYTQEVNGTYIASKNKSISEYALSLQEAVELLKQKTGAPKVNIIAHSMGGLVAREYLATAGEAHVHKLIMVGTPNAGVKSTVESFCPFIGAQQECTQMRYASSFLHALNVPEKEPKQVRVFTVAGRGCLLAQEDSDGITTVESVQLPYALNFEVSGTCSSTVTFHEEMLNVNKYPRVYEILRNVLKN